MKTRLTTLQLMTLKTKKRLSNDHWSLSIWLIATMGLLAIASFTLRATSISWDFGVVDGVIPVAISSSVPPQKGLSLEKNLGRKFLKEQSINDSTIAVVLTRKALYFGPVGSFTKNYSNIRNKYFVDHLEGAPQIDVLKKTIALWAKAEKRALSKQVVLLPTSEIPMPIVIQTMAKLKEDRQFENVILGSGLI